MKHGAHSAILVSGSCSRANVSAGVLCVRARFVPGVYGWSTYDGIELIAHAAHAVVVTNFCTDFPSKLVACAQRAQTVYNGTWSVVDCVAICNHELVFRVHHRKRLAMCRR